MRAGLMATNSAVPPPFRAFWASAKSLVENFEIARAGSPITPSSTVRRKTEHSAHATVPRRVASPRARCRNSAKTSADWARARHARAPAAVRRTVRACHERDAVARWALTGAGNQADVGSIVLSKIEQHEPRFPVQDNDPSMVFDSRPTEISAHRAHSRHKRTGR